jgi:hypothetical protein
LGNGSAVIVAEEFMYIAGRSMTAEEVFGVIEVMWEWLRELDKTGKYSQPNGHLWNAIDQAAVNRRA